MKTCNSIMFQRLFVFSKGMLTSIGVKWKKNVIWLNTIFNFVLCIFPFRYTIFPLPLVVNFSECLFSWYEIVVEISFIFSPINILNFLLQYKIAGNIFLYEEVCSFYFSKNRENCFMIIPSKSSVCLKSLNLSTFVVKINVINSFKSDELFLLRKFWCNFVLFILLKNGLYEYTSSKKN